MMTMVALESQFVAGALIIPAASRGGKDVVRLIAAIRVEVATGQTATGNYTGNAVSPRSIGVGFQPIHVSLFNFNDANGVLRGWFKNNQMAGDTAFEVASGGGAGKVFAIITLTATGFDVEGNANLLNAPYVWTAWGGGGGLVFTALDVVGNGERNAAVLGANQIRLNAGVLNQVVRAGGLSNLNWMYVLIFETDEPLPHAV